jgi:hypothetical protein
MCWRDSEEGMSRKCLKLTKGDSRKKMTFLRAHALFFVIICFTILLLAATTFHQVVELD